MLNLNKLPQDERTKIKKQEKEIATLNSADLLTYSKGLKAKGYEENVNEHLFEVVHARSVEINNTVSDLKPPVNFMRM